MWKTRRKKKQTKEQNMETKWQNFLIFSKKIAVANWIIFFYMFGAVLEKEMIPEMELAENLNKALTEKLAQVFMLLILAKVQQS